MPTILAGDHQVDGFIAASRVVQRGRYADALQLEADLIFADTERKLIGIGGRPVTGGGLLQTFGDLTVPALNLKASGLTMSARFSTTGSNHFKLETIGGTPGEIDFNTATSQMGFQGVNLLPATDDAWFLGLPGRRWQGATFARSLSVGNSTDANALLVSHASAANLLRVNAALATPAVGINRAPVNGEGRLQIVGDERILGKLDIRDATNVGSATLETTAAGELQVFTNHSQKQIRFHGASTGWTSRDDGSDIYIEPFGARDYVVNVPSGRNVELNVNYGTAWMQLTGTLFQVNNVPSIYGPKGANNAVMDALTVSAAVVGGGGSPVAGFGAALKYNLATPASGTKTASAMETSWLDVTAAAEHSKQEFKVMRAAANVVYLRLDGQNDRAEFPRDVYHSNASGKIGWFGTTPVAKQAAFTQTYATATRTANNLTQLSLTAVSTDISPWGFESSADFDAVITAINAARADIINIKQTQAAIIDTMQAYGEV